jgi:hypothetical protein
MSQTIARRSGRAGKHRQHWSLAEDRMGGDDRQVVILLQVRADEVLEPCAIWQGAPAGCMAIPRQGVEHRGRFKVWLQAIAFQEPGQWDCRSGLTSPGRRYSDMSACMCLYSVTDSQDQDSIA